MDLQRLISSLLKLSNTLYGDSKRPRKITVEYDDGDVLTLPLGIDTKPQKSNLSQCAADIIALLEQSNTRMTQSEFISRLADHWSDCTVRKNLAELVRNGILQNGRHGAERGYSLTSSTNEVDS